MNNNTPGVRVVHQDGGLWVDLPRADGTQQRVRIVMTRDSHQQARVKTGRDGAPVVEISMRDLSAARTGTALAAALIGIQRQIAVAKAESGSRIRFGGSELAAARRSPNGTRAARSKAAEKPTGGRAVELSDRWAERHSSPRVEHSAQETPAGRQTGLVVEAQKRLAKIMGHSGRQVSETGGAPLPPGFDPGKLLSGLERLIDRSTRGDKRAARAVRTQLRTLLKSLGLKPAEALNYKRNRMAVVTQVTANGRAISAPGAYGGNGDVQIRRHDVAQPALEMLRYAYGRGRRPKDLDGGINALIMMFHESLHGFNKGSAVAKAFGVGLLINEIITDVSARASVAQLFGGEIRKRLPHDPRKGSVNTGGGYAPEVGATIDAVAHATGWSTDRSARALTEACMALQGSARMTLTPGGLLKAFVKSIPGLHDLQRHKIADSLKAMSESLGDEYREVVRPAA